MDEALYGENTYTLLEMTELAGALVLFHWTLACQEWNVRYCRWRCQTNAEILAYVRKIKVSPFVKQLV